MRCTVIALMLWTFALPTATASDFWDEVRIPGLRAWKQDVGEARISVGRRQWKAALEHADRAIARIPERRPPM